MGDVYPLGRFTETAKKVLTLAQGEAERSYHSYIGTEHLVLGLLREGDGLAAKVLNSLGVEIDKVRSTIESVLGRNQRISSGQIVPTSRVKKVIEISFEEAFRRGNNYVGTEHLLLGLLIEGEGIAAHVLEDLGAGLEKVRLEVDRLLLAGSVDQEAQSGTSQPPSTLARLVDRMHLSWPDIAALAVLDGALTEAEERGTRTLTAADLLLGLLSLDDDPVRTMLADHGIDRDAVIRLGDGT